MIDRPEYTSKLSKALRRSPVTAILGPRQCGKTTLARLYGAGKKAEYFDLESQPDLQRLQNPELVLGSMKGIVILDEIQFMPTLFSTLRVLVDRPKNEARFLILGSASPGLVKNVSETLAGRVEFIELSGFDINETGAESWQTLWLRGGFPRSFLSDSDDDSHAWLEGFIKTFLERYTSVGHHHSCNCHASILDYAGALSRTALECIRACQIHGLDKQDRAFISRHPHRYLHDSSATAMP